MDIETDSYCDNLFTFKPVHPTKMYYIDREQTFVNWLKQIVQKPSDLIQIGFFYTGIHNLLCPGEQQRASPPSIRFCPASLIDVNKSSCLTSHTELIAGTT
jgi:hypothetical protein